MTEENDEEDVIRPRPFWSGTIAFGLVSLPVSLFPANRGRSLSLKMVDRDGTPLSRRYFCEQEQKVLTRDEIVRGYKIEEDQYIVVEDRELEALAPEKSREIDLRRFVKLDEINPMYFERAYFLVPDEGATKAYRLLAKSMEDENRAGIATFVMRGKEYLVAIIAELGILRAETLRFHDEVRSPEYIGLPQSRQIDAELVQEMQQAMRKLSQKTFERHELKDQYVERVMRHVRKKLSSGKDVVKAPEEVSEELAEESNVVDLMKVLKERLKGRKEQQAADGHGKAASRRQSGGKKDEGELRNLSKDKLYERAQELGVPGRSRMSKKELIETLSQRS